MAQKFILPHGITAGTICNRGRISLQPQGPITSAPSHRGALPIVNHPSATMKRRLIVQSTASDAARRCERSRDSPETPSSRECRRRTGATTRVTSTSSSRAGPSSPVSHFSSSLSAAVWGSRRISANREMAARNPRAHELRARPSVRWSLRLDALRRQPIRDGTGKPPAAIDLGPIIDRDKRCVG